MPGIQDFGAYIPIYRLGPETEGWSGSTERAVANFDEDSTTMAVAAVRDCLRGLDRDGIDALYLASTTLTYQEKQAATLVATAADLPDDLFTSDMGNSLRAGSLTLAMALDAVAAGRVNRGLVVATDSRLGEAGSDFERTLGDGAVCFQVGPGDEIAVLEELVSVTNEMYGVWRPAGQPTLQSWEDRFVHQEGYLDSVGRVVRRLEEKTGRTLGSFDRVVLVAPDQRRHTEAARMLGLPQEKLQPPMFDGMGNTGAAFALMQLAAALEQASPNESILVIDYGDGAEALVLRTTERLAARNKARNRGIAGHLASRLPVPAYSEYLGWRGLFAAHTGVRRPNAGGPSASALHREQEQVLRFHGVRCRACGTVMYPPQRICVSCNARDDFDPASLADEPAKLFTYSMDYIAGTADVPLVLSIVDFENGARAVLMMTDRDVDRIAIDMPIEVGLRLARSGAGITNYYWKALPARELFAPGAGEKAGATAVG